MSGTQPYDANAIGVSRLVVRGRGAVDRPILAALLVGGWAPVVATLAAVDPGEATTAFLVGQVLAALMVVSGPFDVWYFDQRLLPRFFQDADKVLTAAADTTVADLAARFDRLYGRYGPRASWCGSSSPSSSSDRSTSRARGSRLSSSARRTSSSFSTG